jgi:excisionase family DNA binding protein
MRCLVAPAATAGRLLGCADFSTRLHEPGLCSQAEARPILSPGGNRPVDRKTISIMKACDLVGVSRRTIYNWLSSGKVEYVRTAGGSVRIFVDTLWRDPHRSDQPAVDTVWDAEGRTRA